MSVRTVFLDGETLTPEQIVEVGENPSIIIDLTEAAWKAVARARAVVDRVLQRREVAYGINTGFGNFANVIIPTDELAKLQANLIRSHAAGVGDPLKPHQTRMLMVLRANVFAKGHSGIRPETLRRLLAALNKNCLPLVPSKGTVGASGDLAPLSHLALGLMGEGQMWDPADETFKPAAQVLQAHDLEPITLMAKEGLALINGTQFISAIGVEALVRAQRAALQADVIAALTLEALHGSSKPFHPAIHAVRPHCGQQAVAARLRRLLRFGGTPSQIMRSHVHCGKVQDSYTMRCVPQIHGISHDTIAFVRDVLQVECNSATDNPMIFPDIPANQVKSRSHSIGADDDAPPHPDDVQAVIRNISEASVGLHLQCAAPHHHDHHHAHPHSMLGHHHDHYDEMTTTGTILSPEQHSHSRHHQAHPDHEAHDHGHHHHHHHHHHHDHHHHDHEQDGSSSEKKADAADAVDDEDMGVIISGGNFHGEYPAKALDYLAIGVSELAAVAERRVERLVNPHLSALPAFLVKQGGLNSGFMIAHCTAAALVSENKVLCHPSSVDSLSTSAAQEDHVSMGGMSARKALEVVANVERVLAIELLAAVQALEFSAPLKTTAPLEGVHRLVRSVVAPWESDRFMAPDIDAAVQLLRANRIWEAARPWLNDEDENSAAGAAASSPTAQSQQQQ